MSDARMVYEIDGLEFQWHGGEYIEIGYTAQEDTGPFNGWCLSLSGRRRGPAVRCGYALSEAPA